MPNIFRADQVGYQRFTLSVYIGLVLLVLAACIVQSGGRFIYPLDDTYIHLAVAENILRGGYGINFPETSSPSSSILYPWILSGTLALGLGEFGPLVLGLVAGGACSWLIAGFWWRQTVLPGSVRSVALAFVAGPLLLLAGNVVGLSVLGMEHSLHVLCTVVVLVGLTGLRRDAPVSSYLLAGLFFAPLIRFEGAALTSFGLVALVWQGHRVAALVLAVVLAAVVALHGWYMHVIGLSLLPSSVLVKSGVSAAVFDNDTTGAARAVFATLKSSLSTHWGVIFILAIGLAIFAAFRENGSDSRQRLLVAGAVVATLGAHLLFGRYGWMARYEVYAVVLMLLGLAYLFSDQIKATTAHNRIRGISYLVLLAVLTMNYVAITSITPKASRNIYVQQYQMHRLVTDYFDYPVAVNDLGWVSFRNDNYVLDLWGLGSETARRLVRMRGMSATAIDSLTQSKGIKFAMLYESWFRDLPANWCRVAVLKTEVVSAGSDRTSLFLLDPSMTDEMAAALTEFRQGLPDGTTYIPSSCSDRDA